jgi:hypothetical protein
MPLTQSASPVAVDAMPWNINDASDASDGSDSCTDSWKTQHGILENQVLAVLGGLARSYSLISSDANLFSQGRIGSDRCSRVPGEHAGLEKHDR